MAGGDRLTCRGQRSARRRGRASTTQAAEKIYRSDGAETEVDVRLALDAGARLAWLPQEQILFDRRALQAPARCRDAPRMRALTLVESIVFGRVAPWARRVRHGLLPRPLAHPARRPARLRRGRAAGRADRGALLARPALAGGARAVATFCMSRPTPKAALDEARAHAGGRALANAAPAPWTVCSWHGSCALRPAGLARRSRPLPRALPRTAPCRGSGRC